MLLTVKAQWFKKKQQQKKNQTENQKGIRKNKQTKRKPTTIYVNSECALCFQALCNCSVV